MEITGLEEADAASLADSTKTVSGKPGAVQGRVLAQDGFKERTLALRRFENLKTGVV